MLNEDFLKKNEKLSRLCKELLRLNIDEEFVQLMMIDAIESFNKSKNIQLINTVLQKGELLGFNVKRMVEWMYPLISHEVLDKKRFEKKTESKDYPSHEEMMKYVAISESWHKLKVQEKNQTGSTRHIPDELKDKVWRRDQGKCTACGSKIDLEFDHISPYSKGGDTTYRNLQLLCQTCNRNKSDNDIYYRWK